MNNTQQPLLSDNALTVLNKRYLIRDDDGNVIEKPSDMFLRVAGVVAEVEDSYVPGTGAAYVDKYYDLMTNLYFLPNTPTLTNAGRPLGQLAACFVLPVGDSIPEIFEAIKHSAIIHQTGGGTGFSFSSLRPAGALVSTTKGQSSGPISFMKVFNSATESIKQGGTRRGANMGLLRVDHPDIEDFMVCKDKQESLNNFNISIGLTEAFMKALETGTDYDLLDPRTKTPCGKLNSRSVFDTIVKQSWKNGEPGVIFLDRMNAANPTPHIGEIESTNPCGEQPLLPYESCNLGSVNLGHPDFVKTLEDGTKEINWELLIKIVSLSARFLDNIIDANKYPLPEIERMTKGNRKIGLGIMGWADMLVRLRIPYDSPRAIETARTIMELITNTARETSIELAFERGTFPNFEGSVWQKKQIGVRNATSTTIAPTGTISIIANASSGIEPHFAVSFWRSQADTIMSETLMLFEEIARERGFWSDNLPEMICQANGSIAHLDEIPEDVRNLFRTAHDVSPEWHVTMQSAFQEYTDNAVSKTVNLPHTATIEDVEKIYRLAYKQGCKGVTIYRDGSRDEQVLSTNTVSPGPTKTEKSADTTIAPSIPPHPRPFKRSRPHTLKGHTYQMQTGCGPFYVTINENGGEVFELLTTIGKAGGCAASQAEAVGRMISLAWRSGITARQVIKQLKGISCHLPAGFGENKILSCADAIASAISTHLASRLDEELPVEFVSQILSEEEANLFNSSEFGSRGACPECGGIIEHEGGCCCCKSCGYSEC